MMLSKRSFLRLLAAFAAMGESLIGARPGKAMPAPASRDRAAALRHLFSQPANAAAVGRRYLQQCPGEADADRLIGVLEMQIGVQAAAVPGTAVPSLAEAGSGPLLRAAVRQDFAQGNIVELDGWILARSELRLCALAALLLPAGNLADRGSVRQSRYKA